MGHFLFKELNSARKRMDLLFEALVFMLKVLEMISSLQQDAHLSSSGGGSVASVFGSLAEARLDSVHCVIHFHSTTLLGHVVLRLLLLSTLALAIRTARKGITIVVVLIRFERVHHFDFDSSSSQCRRTTNTRLIGTSRSSQVIGGMSSRRQLFEFSAFRFWCSR